MISSLNYLKNIYWNKTFVKLAGFSIFPDVCFDIDQTTIFLLKNPYFPFNHPFENGRKPCIFSA